LAGAEVEPAGAAAPVFVPPVTLETLLEAPETAEETAAEADEAIEDTTPCEEDGAVEDAAAALLLIMLDSDSMLLICW
jgi:hypothetical protein